MKRMDRFRGCLQGLAIGDSVGTTLEFAPPGNFDPIIDMVGGGPFQLKPGEWTDDTSMALCLAESLVNKREFDPSDQMEKYLLWWRTGYLSHNGRCFDIGTTVSTALRSFEITRDPYSGLTDRFSAGNGSIMRLAPVPMFFSGDPRAAIEMSGKSSMTTHGVDEAVDACRLLGAIIVGALNGISKSDLISDGYCPIEDYWNSKPLTQTINEISNGSFKRQEPPYIKGSGHVVKSLEAALWAFYNSTTFEEGCLLAVNLGDDADTTGAVYGQLAGAFYGESGIPDRWLDKLAMRSNILDYSERLFELSAD